ncbi:hypothetical protein HAX54_039585 [Datura stramonium]|uniref:Uncharacterized protein n=1 Tax=Datura stramonium TaxID=4076 RepID=A0ABS8SJC4_DATST|nr:hypothetical protein [Datura stramonium]
MYSTASNRYYSISMCFLCFQGQFRGRTEIAPDQREKFLQRFQQILQQFRVIFLAYLHLVESLKQFVPATESTFATVQFSKLLCRSSTWTGSWGPSSWY